MVGKISRMGQTRAVWYHKMLYGLCHDIVYSIGIFDFHNKEIKYALEVIEYYGRADKICD